MNNDPLTPVPSERLLGPGYGQGVWPLRERLALATALLDVDNQQGSWSATSRRMVCFSRPGRPSTWCSSRACAKQYALLLDSIELVKRQKMPGSDSQSSQLSLAERVVKRLSAERAEELRSRIRYGQHYYSSLKNILLNVESGMYDSQLAALLDEMNSFSDSKKKLDNTSTESDETNMPQSNSLSKQQTSTDDVSLNEPKTKQHEKCSDTITAENDSVEKCLGSTENFIGLWKEIHDFYHIPDSTWYCAPGPINNRNSSGGFGNVTSRSRPSAGVGSVNFSRLSTLLAEASSPALKPTKQSRHSVNKSMTYKSSKHEVGHTTAASRAAEATKQRYLSTTSKGKFLSCAKKSNISVKSSKQDKSKQHLSEGTSRKSKYQGDTSSSSTSKADRLNQNVNRKSQPSDSTKSHQRSYSDVFKKSLSNKKEISDNSDEDDDKEKEHDSEDSLYEGMSTDMQTDSPSSTPSTVAMCTSDIEDFLMQDDTKSENTIPNNDDTMIYSTIDNDRTVTEIADEDEINVCNSEEDKCIVSDVASSLSTEAVVETECQADDKLSSITSSPALVNTTHVHENLTEDELNQKSSVETVVESFKIDSSGTVNVCETDNELNFEDKEPEINYLVENLDMPHEGTCTSDKTEIVNVALSTLNQEESVIKKLKLSTKSTQQHEEVNKSTSKKIPTYSILPFLIKTERESSKSSPMDTLATEIVMTVQGSEKSDENITENAFENFNLHETNTPVSDANISNYPADESSQLNSSSTSQGQKHRSLRLRLSRQGSQLIVLPPSDSTSISPQALNTPSKEITFHNTSSDTSWYSWANQLLSDGERVSTALVSNDELLLTSPRSRNHISLSEVNALVHELLDPIMNDLNDKLITSRLEFIHRLLSVLAETVMTRANNNIRHRIAIELYLQWHQQLQTDEPQPHFSSTPYCYDLETPAFWSNETEDNSMNTSINPPTLTLASSLNSSSPKLHSDTVKSLAPFLPEVSGTNLEAESFRGKRPHSSIEDDTDSVP
ncbi:unnamed protein product [Heterobilharzia americana]|nr:unnamed protein product [Heterobilharzia americana]